MENERQDCGRAGDCCQAGREKEIFMHRTLSRNQLKWIAIWTMVIDHIGCLLIPQSIMPVLYYIMRGIGRISFPLICFLLVQGFIYTHSLGKYLARLWCFALISEIPYDLAFSGKSAAWSSQNIFFTLGIGLAVLWGIAETEKRIVGVARGIADLLILFAGMGTAVLLRCDYSMWGILMITAFYVCRYDFGVLLRLFPVICLCQSWMEALAALSLIPVKLYSPDQEQGRTRMPGGFFYWFYPLHLLVLWGIYKWIC